jgi:lipopolysaccharide/colanic/teichoic acid biosynthesis glycosyltransferase
VTAASAIGTFFQGSLMADDRLCRYRQDHPAPAASPMTSLLKLSSQSPAKERAGSGAGPLVRAPHGLYPDLFKRVVDVGGAVVLILLTAPVMALVGTAVWLVLGRPILHRELRAGRAGVPFALVKFRSMSDRRDATGRLLPDADRLTTFGRLLRRTSLDELPQLFAVLFGRMSLVGPRPLPTRYTERYSPRQATRLLVRPGLTGWAQIHGRNMSTWTRRLELDARYVELLCLWYAPLTDLWIVVATLFLTVGQAVTGRGITAAGSATMEEFFP